MEYEFHFLNFVYFMMYLIKKYTKLEHPNIHDIRMYWGVICEATGWVVLSFHTECNKATFKMSFKNVLLGSHNCGIPLVLKANCANL